MAQKRVLLPLLRDGGCWVMAASYILGFFLSWWHAGLMVAPTSFVITSRESLSCRIRGKPESSNWLVLYDQSEIIKNIMSAEGIYNKSKIQENLVAARQPSVKYRWMQRWSPRLLLTLPLPLWWWSLPQMGHQSTHEICFNLSLISLDEETKNNFYKNLDKTLKILRKY